MRSLVLGTLLCFSSGLVSAQSSIRQVDFKNFTYPLSGPLLGHGELKWLGDPRDGYSKQKPVHLVNGDDLAKSSSFVMDGHEYTQWMGFTLQSVAYADVTGDIYSLAAGKPKLLAYCHTGSRAYLGLDRVYGERGNLVFELLDPRKIEGECCSSGFVRTRYRWDGSRFQTVGRREYGSTEIETHSLTR